MNASESNQGQNEAVTLLNKILGNQHRGRSSNEQQVIEVATNCTQLLNTVACASTLLRHPSVLAATHIHGQLVPLARNIASNADLAKQELLRIHQTFNTQLESQDPDMDEGTQLMSMIGTYQAYEEWLDKFTNVVLLEYGALTKLLESVDVTTAPVGAIAQ